MSHKKPLTGASGSDSLGQSYLYAWDELYRTATAPVWGNEPVPVIADALRHVPGKLTDDSVLLDAGTGDGRNVPLLRGLPGRILCCDASVAALSKCAAAHVGAVQAAACNLARLPVRSGTVSLILCWDTLVSIADLKGALQEFKRVLACSGGVVFNIPSGEPPAPDEHLVPLSRDTCLYQGRYFIRNLAVEEAEQLFEACGLHISFHQVFSWCDSGHGSYRAGPHVHTSHVCVAVKEG